MSFIDAVKDTLDEEFNYSVTENGALGYRTSGKELLDMNFSVASMRKMSEDQIYARFTKAYFENKALALRWLFYARDIRWGLGERRLFRVILTSMAKDYPEVINRLIPLVNEYGRYDDLWDMLDNSDVCDTIVEFVKKQLEVDLTGMKNNKSISLLAKWLPSGNASAAKTKTNARLLCKKLGLTERQYRKTLSKLRAYIDVVERKMSAKQWENIKYEAVPSRANLIYNDAFLRNDEERRREYLSKLEKGETKINAGTLFPHDIVHKYGRVSRTDATIEALWRALPDMVQGCGNTIVVADGSRSMTCRVDNNSGVTALEVANALAIYFAEHSSGDFKDKYITFSERPQLVDFSSYRTLRDKLSVAYQHSEVANTNIEKVFDLILTTAIKNHMSQEEIPQNVLIISDMEFDSCATSGECRSNGLYGWYSSLNRPDSRLFAVIKKRFEDAGYKLPRLVFWNVNSRTSTIPVKENDLGVALVSGFSVNICKMVMSGKTDPYECLVETLMNERYDAVENALK